MAYRFKLDEDIADGVRRILGEQSDRAAMALASAGSDAASGVHEARKALKRMRALLRLVRPGLADDDWLRENAALRDIARQLAGKRDAQVARDMIVQLSAGAPRPLEKALARLAASFDSDLAGPGDAVPCARDGVRAPEMLAKVRTRLVRLSLTGDPLSIIEEGLAASHRRGRRTLARARDAGTPETLHELRKAVQLHWRQMTLLAAAWPALMKARAAEARRLSALLGEDHDLALLESRAMASAGQGIGKADARRIASACRQHQAASRAVAVVRADRLLCGRPGRFARETIGWWRAAAMARHEPGAGDAPADLSEG
jgi:CHAD domain-containing protein